MAFDDACYKLERSLAMREAPQAAHEYCANIYGASGLVINSIAEATFLQSFLTEIDVRVYSKYMHVAFVSNAFPFLELSCI